MRVLLGCSLGGLGHLTPIAAAARALGRLGHESVVLVPPALSDAAREAGIRAHVGGEPPRSVIDGMWERVRAGPPEAVAGLMDRELFAGHCTDAMLDAAARLCDEWAPELVVREPCEYATAVVAHRNGIPQLQIGISQSAIDHAVLRRVSETVDRHDAGVAQAILGSPYLTSFPASLDPSPWADTRRFRQQPSPEGRGRLPDWWPGDTRPLVYMTFGSVLSHLPEAPGVFRAALAAVTNLPARVLLTIGHAADPVRVGAIPRNTHLEAWVPQDDVFPHAALVVCHGGSGTTFGALAAGLPLVLCPLLADQSANARVVADAGAGVLVSPRRRAAGGLAHLGADDISPLRAAITAALAEPGYREAAQRIAGEITTTATLDEALCGYIDGGSTGRAFPNHPSATTSRRAHS